MKALLALLLALLLSITTTFASEVRHDSLESLLEDSYYWKNLTTRLYYKLHH